MTQAPRKLKVAVVQLRDWNHRESVDDVIATAERFVAQAAEQGAQIVLLPELAFSGYHFSPYLWCGAEAIPSGRTCQFLQRCATTHRIHIGCSLLQAVDDRLLNTFVLVDPSGHILGAVHKSQPASIEAAFFEGQHGPHTIHLPDLNLTAGVAICYENFLSAVHAELSSAVPAPDIILSPFSAPLNTPNRYCPDSFCSFMASSLHTVTTTLSRTFKVPVLAANKVGPFHSPVPLPLFPHLHSYFPGWSAVSDSDSSLLFQLGPAEAVGLAEVTLSPSLKASATAPSYPTWWASPSPPHIVARFMPFGEFMGARRYKQDRLRKDIALAVSSGDSQRFEELVSGIRQQYCLLDWGERDGQQEGGRGVSAWGRAAIGVLAAVSLGVVMYRRRA